MSQPSSAPIGPGSLTWQHFGDMRELLLFGRVGTLQNMHPAVGRALQDHSNFFNDPSDRLVRSLPPILGVVYDAPGDGTGGEVRDFHRDIKGTHADGARYHALDPEVFWWTHATFIELIIATQGFFGTPLTEDEKDQLVREGVTWWRRYGLSDRPVIDNYSDFSAYWNEMLETVLERNVTTDWAFEVDPRTLPAFPGVPGPLWWIIRRPALRANLWLTNATLPPRARQTLGLEWHRRDELAFRVFARSVRTTWPLLPEIVRIHPRARQGMKRPQQESETARAA
ncbi:MAG TPA: oxygenase MpaB family protein [Nocardioidaceae bacterium]|nr:oxygenase MpaB family protein [Nocardioidaceae bacterium]